MPASPKCQPHPKASLTQKQEAFTDVLLSALIAGLTNVVTYTIDDLGTPITTLPGNTGRVVLHRLVHSNDMQLRDIVKANHMAQIARMVTKLKSIPEGTGTMFDSTTIVYFPETGAGHHGPDTEAPMVIMTGKQSKLDIAGRFIRLPFHATKGHTTLLNAYGNPVEHYGDFDVEMSRKKMDPKGAIQQLMGLDLSSVSCKFFGSVASRRGSQIARVLIARVLIAPDSDRY